MGCVAALLVLLSAAEPSLPVLCIDAPPAMTDDVAEAVRVRLDGRRLRVTSCAAIADVPAWSVTVRPTTDEVVMLAIDGETTWSHELDAHGLHAAELSRVIALHVVEAVRPSVDATLVRLGLVPAASLGKEPEVVASPLRFALDARAGALLGASPFHADAQAQIDAGVTHQTLRFTGGVAVRSMSGARRAGVNVDGGELHVELAGRKSWDVVELGAHARARATRFTLESDNPNVRDGARSSLDYGLGVSGLVWPWRGERLAVGLIVQITAWTRPHLLAVEGQELFRQARLDVFVGPVVEFQL